MEDVPLFDPHLDDHTDDTPTYGSMDDYDPENEPRASCVPLPEGFRREPGLPVPEPADYQDGE